MLGTSGTIRTYNWFAETSAALTATANSNTNVQVPYRLPLDTENTRSVVQTQRCAEQEHSVDVPEDASSTEKYRWLLWWVHLESTTGRNARDKKTVLDCST